MVTCTRLCWVIIDMQLEIAVIDFNIQETFQVHIYLIGLSIMSYMSFFNIPVLINTTYFNVFLT